MCRIVQNTEASAFIFWYHDNRMINYDVDRGINVSTEAGISSIPFHYDMFDGCCWPLLLTQNIYVMSNTKANYYKIILYIVILCVVSGKMNLYSELE